VKKWTIGFNKLKSLVANYPPQKAAEITWVSEEKIVKATTVYATNKPSCITFGNALDQHTNNFQAIRAISSLIALTGNIDIPGGNVLTSPLKKFVPIERKKDRSQAIGEEQLPIFAGATRAHLPSVWNAILTGEPYPIKGMIVIGANPTVTSANIKIVLEALKKLEFLVVVEFFMTPTARLADVILPATTFLETESEDKIKVVDPQGECWPDVKIIIELAKRLGFEEQFPSSVEEAMKETKRIQVSSVAEYKKYEKGGFPTASGKVELYSSVLKELGINPLPVYVEPHESPVSKMELAKQFPLVLTSGGKVSMFTHSQFRNIPRLKKLMPHNLLEVHPKTAAKFEIENGDYVIVESPRGNITLRTKLTNGILQGVVHIYHGFEDANVNELIDHQVFDSATGSTGLKSSLCRIRKVE
jgi:anaerobic selenocysteine-containing dehydrogenase